jgi:hypothetical protein
MATLAPSVASRFAIAAPMPREPPVTSATLFANLDIISPQLSEIDDSTARRLLGGNHSSEPFSFIRWRDPQRGCRDIALFGSQSDNRFIGHAKGFSQKEVLKKAMPVFWKHGFADTSLQDLERATGVNKSGLYTEFRDKEDLFVACLRHYLESQGKRGLLPGGLWPSSQHYSLLNENPA